jgi:hypothetical protein
MQRYLIAAQCKQGMRVTYCNILFKTLYKEAGQIIFDQSPDLTVVNLASD